MTKKIIRSSGNVFADIGIQDAEEHRLKAGLALKIIDIIEECNLTQSAAAVLMSVKQSVISDIKKGTLKNYTSDDLFDFLFKLGHTIAIDKDGKKWALGQRGSIETDLGMEEIMLSLSLGKIEENLEKELTAYERAYWIDKILEKTSQYLYRTSKTRNDELAIKNAEA